MIPRAVCAAVLLAAVHGAAFAAPWTLDPSFANGGIAASVFGTFVSPVTGAPLPSFVRRVIVQRDGKLLSMVTQTTAEPSSQNNFRGEYARVIARYDVDGALDPSFVGSGSMILPTQTDPTDGVVAVQDDGKIVMADTVTKNFQTFVVLSRYHADGRPDMGFGLDGASTFNVFEVGYNAYAAHLIITRDGSIVLVARANAKSVTRPLLAKFTPSGILDASFGTNGIFIHQFAPILDGFPPANPYRAFEQRDGTLVIVGDCNFVFEGYRVAFRVSANGVLDPTFGTEGYAMIPRIVERYLRITDAFQRHDGRFVLSGFDNDDFAVPVPVLIGLMPDGSPDASFGQGGIATGIVPGFDTAEITAIVPQGDGRFVTANAAKVTRGQYDGAYLARYDRNGFLDASFGDGGVIRLQGFERAQALAQQSDGKWVAGGALTGDQPAALVRILPATIPVVEFHRADIDHYFVTSNPLEIADLDRGAHAGWMRTGQAFQVFGSADAATVPARDVCRFYIPPSRGDSHFFSVSAAECARVEALMRIDPNYAGYVFETPRAFLALMPDAASGVCPPASNPVYRVWNSRVDSNHRYTVDRAIRDAMVAKGWVAEGYGPAAVAMCAAR